MSTVPEILDESIEKKVSKNAISSQSISLYANEHLTSGSNKENTSSTSGISDLHNNKEIEDYSLKKPSHKNHLQHDATFALEYPIANPKQLPPVVIANPAGIGKCSKCLGQIVQRRFIGENAISLFFILLCCLPPLCFLPFCIGKCKDLRWECEKCRDIIRL